MIITTKGLAKIKSLPDKHKFKNAPPGVPKSQPGPNYTKPLFQPLVKYCICLDWLEYTTKGYFLHPDTVDAPNRIKLSDNVELGLADHGTKHYRFTYHVYFADDPQPFATILTLPRKKNALNGSFSQIKLENWSLYRSDCIDKVVRLNNALGVELNNLTRIDIAIDGRNLMWVFSAWKAGRLAQIGRKVATDEKCIGRELDLFHWGSQGAKRSLKGYRKGKTIEKQNKQYIREWWRLNGLIGPDDTGDDIERLEISMRADACKRVIDPETGELGVDLTRLDKTKYLAGIMKVQFQNWFEFAVPSQKDTNKSRWKRIKHIHWEHLEALDLERLSTTKSPSETWRAKRATQKLILDGEKYKYLQDAAKFHLEHNSERTFNRECLDGLQPKIKSFLKTGYPYHIPDEVLTGLVDGVIKDHLSNQILFSITDETVKDLPLVMGFAMAREHSIDEWVRRRLFYIQPKVGMKYSMLDRTAEPAAVATAIA